MPHRNNPIETFVFDRSDKPLRTGIRVGRSLYHGGLKVVGREIEHYERGHLTESHRVITVRSHSGPEPDDQFDEQHGATQIIIEGAAAFYDVDQRLLDEFKRFRDRCVQRNRR